MSKQKSVYAFMRNNFIAGITAILPVAGVYFLVTFIVRRLNEWLLSPVFTILNPYIPWADPRYVKYSIKIGIFLVILFAIVMIGLLVRNFFVSKLISLGEGILMKVPIVNKIYGAIQQISRTFLINKQSVFDHPVLIEYPQKGSYALGLVTSEAVGEIQEKTREMMVSVFVPTTPNPTSGFLLFVPQEKLIPLDMSIEDSFKLIISFGGVTPTWKPPQQTV